MYNAHKITDKVAAGRLALGSHVGFDSPFVTEMIAGCGFDFIWIDGEHLSLIHIYNTPPVSDCSIERS